MEKQKRTRNLRQFEDYAFSSERKKRGLAGETPNRRHMEGDKVEKNSSGEIAA